MYSLIQYHHKIQNHNPWFKSSLKHLPQVTRVKRMSLNSHVNRVFTSTTSLSFHVILFITLSMYGKILFININLFKTLCVSVFLRPFSSYPSNYLDLCLQPQQKGIMGKKTRNTLNVFFYHSEIMWCTTKFLGQWRRIRGSPTPEIYRD